MKHNKIHENRYLEKIQKRGEYIQVYFPSPLDRQCCLCLCRRRNTTKGRRWRRRRREDRLQSSFVVIVAGREREVGSRLYAAELSDDDDDDDTSESSPQGRESFHALVSTKACCVNSLTLRRCRDPLPNVCSLLYSNSLFPALVTAFHRRSGV